MKGNISILAIALILMCVGASRVGSQSYSPDQGWGPVEQPTYGTGRGLGREYGPAYRIGPGMMDDCYAPGMAPGYEFQGRTGRDLWKSRYGARLTKACQDFLDETAQLRKDLSRKRFDYYEALRNPRTSSGTLDQMEKEMSDLNRKIWARNPHKCWWY